MGGCFGGGDPLNKRVDEELNQDRKKDSSVHKLLFLGIGGSGKSTFFNQLKTVHGDGHSDKDREGFKQHVIGQIIWSMHTLIKQCYLQCEVNNEYKDKTNNNNNNNIIIESDSDNENTYLNKIDKKLFEITQEFQESADFVLKIHLSSTQLLFDAVEHIKNLWTKCNAIQEMFKHRSKIFVPDSTKFFLDDIDRVTKIDYLPSDEDIVLSRHRTTGMHEKEITVNEAKFRIVDVGGQRSERRKWIHFFDKVSAVLFVVSLSCYDEVPFEEVTNLNIDLKKHNQMLESISVFKQTLNENTFVNTPFILFLNKKDLLRDKISKIPITVAFPDYSGKQEYKACVVYIRDRFKELNTNSDRLVFCHVTCATDKENVQRVFRDVQQTVIDEALKASELM